MNSLLDASQSWSSGKKMIFRFIFLYFALYILNDPYLGEFFNIPKADWYSSLVFGIWKWFMPIMGNQILGFDYDIAVGPNGSGDTTANYVAVFTFFLLSVLGTLLWTILDKKRINYSVMSLWFIAAVRYYLAFVLLSYGWVKLIQLQFPFPGLMRLLTTYGESSPMGLAWNFMGYSASYNWFTGLGEILGGLFLLSRRTSTFGAALAFGVMFNVMMINFGYDVPVKLFSAHLVLMALFLLTIDAPRLANFFFSNKATQAVKFPPYFSNPRFRKIFLGFKIFLIAYVLFMNIQSALKGQKSYGTKSPNPPLYGIYEVKNTIINGDTIPALLTDSTYWEHLVFNKYGSLQVKTATGDVSFFQLSVDTVQQRVEFNLFRDTINKSHLNYVSEHEKFIFTGIISGDTTHLETHRKDPSDFLLVNRSFHWINEYPYNR